MTRTANKNSVLKNTKINLLFLFVFSLFTIFSLFACDEVNAQEGALTVAPARQIIKADPGEIKYINVKFLNQADTPISGDFNVSDFLVTDSSGTPRFLDLNPEFTSNYSAASWVVLPYTKGTISSKSILNLQIKINVPLTAKPGGRYFGVYFEPTSSVPTNTQSEFEAGTGITTRLAGLVYLRVTGPVTENATVKTFKTDKFWEYGPITVSTEILNLGNYHIKPEAEIILTNMLGREVAKVKLEDVNIFPETSRFFENELGQTYMFGKYKVTLDGIYGEEANLLQAQTSFWAFPWKLTLAVILGIIIVILLTYLVWKNLKTRQQKLETKLEKEISEIEGLKNKYKDTLPKK